MKHLKKFNEKTHFDLADDIAEDLYPQLKKMRKEGKVITTYFFEEFMKERGADLGLTDAVISSLVSMGFDFDPDEDFDARFI
jgi:hypothetical protein